MILFQGYMGTVLHTGDMRFDEKLIYENPILYPKYLRNPELKNCSIHIDELIFDNTFCDPIFKFGKKEEALKEIKEVIDENRDSRILISIDSLGKEDLLIHLAEHYKTPIVVNHERYKNIKSINLRPEVFTTIYEEGWIEVIKKAERGSRLRKPNEKNICIVPTGWGNGKKFVSSDKKVYVISYSLHSNYEEIESFIKSIGPANLIALNRKSNENKKWEKIQEFSNYLISLMHYQQKGFGMLAQKYVRPETLSKEFLNLRKNPEFQKKLNIELGVKLTEAEILDENKKLFEKKYQQILQPKKKMNKGLKISEPENNKFLQKDEIERIQEAKSFKEAVPGEEDFVLVNSSKENDNGSVWVLDSENVEESGQTMQKTKEKFKKDSFEVPPSKTKSKSSGRTLVFEAMNFTIDNLASKAKRTFLEDWMVNSLVPETENRSLSLEEKKKKAMESEKNEPNMIDTSLSLKNKADNSVSLQVGQETKENSPEIKSKPHAEISKNTEFQFDMERFQQNRSLREILKQRKSQRREEMSNKIKEVFKQNNVEYTVFMESSLMNLLQRNIPKISKSIEN